MARRCFQAPQALRLSERQAQTRHFAILAANALELWEFHEPSYPIPPTDQAAVGLMHFAVTVDDVPAAVARVESAGGRTRFPVKQLAGADDSAQFVYCEDPDGHVFELLNRTHPETVAIINARQGT